MFLDLHVHTRFSPDSVSSPDRLLDVAKRRGLHGLAITDHESIRGALVTRDRNRDPDFHVIVGCEVATEAGDIIGLFLTDEIRSRVALEVISEIHEQGGLALLPHPFQRRPPPESVAAAVDLVEVFNARSSPESNRRAQELAGRLGKPAICASDAHFVSDVGTCRVFVDGAGRTALLGGARALHTGYTRRYKTAASQMIKAWATGNYRAVALHAASTLKRALLDD
jgi:hypothetical protein